MKDILLDKGLFMAVYKTDLQDIFFNLFDVNNAQKYAPDYEVNDLKEIISQFDKFNENEIYPTRQLGDQDGVTLENGQVKAPESYKKANQQFYENGWYGLGYPEEIGGMPAPEAVTIACTSLCVGANVSFSMYYGLTRGAMNVILKVGNDQQRSLYVPKMMEGTWGGTMCLTEPGAGSDVGAAITSAKPLGDGKYSISGVKIFISSGDSDLFENNIHLVLARTPGAAEGVKGLSLFIVPKFKINEDGSNGERNNVVCTKIEHKMGIHGSATCELTFGADGECIGELIGKEGEGIVNMFIMMNEARLLCGLQGEAQANLAFMLTEQYTHERVQFGKEIISHPDVKKTMLKMRAMARGMRALALYTGNLFDKVKEDHATEELIAFLTPICKAYMTDEGFNVAVDAMQMHGGYGYCSEYGIEQFVRDIKIASIYEGTNGIQAIDFIMRKILKDQAKVFMKFGEMIGETMKKDAAQEFSHELAMLGKSMEMSQKILQKFSQMAQAKNMDCILTYATDFLGYCGNIAVGWLLLEHACIAKGKIEGANEQDKKYYQSKIVDFRVFCQFQLVKNIGVANSILNFEEDLVSLEV